MNALYNCHFADENSGKTFHSEDGEDSDEISPRKKYFKKKDDSQKGCCFKVFVYKAGKLSIEDCIIQFNINHDVNKHPVSFRLPLAPIVRRFIHQQVLETRRIDPEAVRVNCLTKFRCYSGPDHWELLSADKSLGDRFVPSIKTVVRIIQDIKRKFAPETSQALLDLATANPSEFQPKLLEQLKNEGYNADGLDWNDNGTFGPQLVKVNLCSAQRGFSAICIPKVQKFMRDKFLSATKTILMDAEAYFLGKSSKFSFTTLVLFLWQIVQGAFLIF